MNGAAAVRPSELAAETFWHGAKITDAHRPLNLHRASTAEIPASKLTTSRRLSPTPSDSAPTQELDMPRCGVCGAIAWGACCDPISVYVGEEDDDGDTVIRGSD